MGSKYASLRYAKFALFVIFFYIKDLIWIGLLRQGAKK